MINFDRDFGRDFLNFVKNLLADISDNSLIRADI